MGHGGLNGLCENGCSSDVVGHLDLEAREPLIHCDVAFRSFCLAEAPFTISRHFENCEQPSLIPGSYYVAPRPMLD